MSMIKVWLPKVTVSVGNVTSHPADLYVTLKRDSGRRVVGMELCADRDKAEPIKAEDSTGAHLAFARLAKSVRSEFCRGEWGVQFEDASNG